MPQVPSSIANYIGYSARPSFRLSGERERKKANTLAERIRRVVIRFEASLHTLKQGTYSAAVHTQPAVLCRIREQLTSWRSLLECYH